MPEDTPAPSSAGSMEEKPCSSSAADSSDVMEEAKKLIGTGNRHLVMGDVVSAVNVFQEACGMLAEKYGDTADECGEAFFLCGKSLLELARMENTVLGNALEGVPEESSEEGEKPDNSKIESADNLDDGDDDDDDDDDDDEGEGTAEDKESEEEEVGNLQLAWEMLEVAKVIYKRQEGKEDQLMAAQAHLKLGEVGAESGNYVQALEDFQECLRLQLKHLPPHSRLLAETHYQLGVTFGYTGQYAQAIQHFNSSVQVIESRLAMLQEAIDKAEGANGAAEEKRETEELKQLLPDIREKVEDARESQKTAGAASVAIQQTLSGASTSAFSGENGGTSSSAPSQIAVTPTDGAPAKSASDISHLVRKKRKPEEESPVKDSDAKKAKQEATVNGNGDSASNGNGVQEKMEQDEPAKPSATVETS
ncbi:nuclear autoantigenic sperm protein isoform X4 [Anguilla anguilla]|uniref:nuclear autoantigenic sperm protein isoform X4 n=1 Tax=Anguilla anguilla TaxID=7936 RepID=UPI0015AE090E|nr:nuclear autoantigenic sperm protein isoform X4 [Anguilla anguilla]